VKPRRVKLTEEERARREQKEREEALGQMREHDIARGRLEGWAGGRVKPLIRDDE
jgi:hypothetical protein